MLYYLATHAANQISEFRTRIIDGKPAIFDVIYPAFTYIPKGRRLHANCLCCLGKNYVETAANIEIARQKADKKPTLTPVGSDKPNLFYFSVVNDVAFTSVSNPWGSCNTDSIPRINFGQVTENETGNQIMPVAVEALHSFIDGRNLGDFFSGNSMRCAENRGSICKNPKIKKWVRGQISFRLLWQLSNNEIMHRINRRSSCPRRDCVAKNRGGL